jgi:hypothetical protein
VQARNPGSGQTSPYSNVTGVCQTGSLAGKAGCYKGQLTLQGKSDHGGTLIVMDGIPMAVTAFDGRWDLCGALPGPHTLRAQGAGYLALEGQVTMPEGSYVEMPTVALAGGDANADDWVNLFDLVRVGADYRSSPPTDGGADINKDNVVNLFDLVLVGTNYGTEGPTAWGPYGVSSHPAGGTGPEAVRAPDVAALPRSMRGPEDGTPLTLAAAPGQDGSYTVDVTARRVRGLYGAEVTLAYDPSKVEVLDASDKVGIQVQPGEAWLTGGNAFIPVNRVDPAKGQIQFSATLTNPSEPLDGDVVIATVRFRPLDGGSGAGAIALTGAQLAGKWPAGAIPARWEGVDVIPLIDIGTLGNKLYLPWAGSGREQ